MHAIRLNDVKRGKNRKHTSWLDFFFLKQHIGKYLVIIITIVYNFKTE